MKTELLPEEQQKPPETSKSAAEVTIQEQEQTAEQEVKKLGWRERGKLAARMLTAPVIKNGLNRIREVDVKALMETAASAAVTGKDHIVHAGVVAGIMALDASGLEDAHIVGKSHEMVGFVGKTLTTLGSGPDGSRSVKMAGSLITKTAGFMQRHPGLVASAEKRIEDALHEKIRKIKEYGEKNE